MIDFEPRELVAAIGQDAADVSLISILEEIQAKYRYLPREAMILVGEGLGLPLSQVYGVATFYNAFSLQRRGRHGVCVCVGTACHVRGAQPVLNRLEETLHIEPGETTPDWNYSLETVNCLARAPWALSSSSTGSIRGRCTPRKWMTCWRTSSKQTWRRHEP